MNSNTSLTTANSKARAVFPPVVAQDCSFPSCLPPPELPAILFGELLRPWPRRAESSHRTGASAPQPFQHTQRAGPAPPSYCSPALQGSSALHTMVLPGDTLSAPLLLAPHNAGAGTGPRLSIRVLRTQGERENCSALPLREESQQLQWMTSCT